MLFATATTVAAGLALTPAFGDAQDLADVTLKNRVPSDDARPRPAGPDDDRSSGPR